MNRRASLPVEWSALLIITGIVLFVMIVVYSVFFTGAKDKFSEEECRTSLLMGAALDRESWFCVKYVSDVAPLKCSRDFLSVSDKKVIKDGADATRFYTAKCPEGRDGNCLAENVIAKEMSACWRQFFEGEKMVFQQQEQSFRRGEGTVACFVCSEIMLNTNEDVAAFTKYLQDMELRDGVSYYSYLTDISYCSTEYRPGTYSNDLCWEQFANRSGIRTDYFAKGRKYAVTFMRYGLDTCDDNSKNKTKSPTLTVQVIPAEEINATCHRVLV